MQVLFQHSSDEVEWDLRSTLHNKLESLVAQEESYWKQQSKATWLLDRDCNTSYFHQKASNCYRKNCIKGLLDANGVWCTTSGDIEQVVVKYFTSMFTSSGESLCDAILDLVPRRVTNDMNCELCSDYFDVEIEEAIFQMDPHTAPGPDGLSYLFFQKFWDVVGNDVIAAVKSFLTSGCILKQLNYSTVSLIPKVPKPKNMT
ncbi:hypothetical protein ACFX15_006490 [Malus domestica]